MRVNLCKPSEDAAVYISMSFYYLESSLLKLLLECGVPILSYNLFRFFIEVFLAKLAYYIGAFVLWQRLPNSKTLLLKWR